MAVCAEDSQDLETLMTNLSSFFRSDLRHACLVWRRCETKTSPETPWPPIRLNLTLGFVRSSLFVTNVFQMMIMMIMMLMMIMMMILSRKRHRVALRSHMATANSQGSASSFELQPATAAKTFLQKGCRPAQVRVHHLNLNIQWHLDVIVLSDLGSQCLLACCVGL